MVMGAITRNAVVSLHLPYECLVFHSLAVVAVRVDNCNVQCLNIQCTM